MLSSEVVNNLSATLTSVGLTPVDGTSNVDKDDTISAEIKIDLSAPIESEILSEIFPPLSADITGEVPLTVATTKVLMNSTAFWNSHSESVISRATIIVYSDYKTVTENGKTSVVPGVKIADGIHDIASLPFISDACLVELHNHINNTEIHITQEERERWNQITVGLFWDYDL